MADAVTYRVWLRFRCDDHRLIGEADQRVDGAHLWHATIRDLIDAMKPVILDRFPHISDSIEYITVEELRLLAD
jgi:hypothetical protein